MKMHGLRHHLAALGAYVLAAILLTYPTALQMGSHIPGGGDAPWFLWQLWWFKHSLIDLLQSPLTTDLLYYPLTDVPVTWQTPFNEVFAIPLQFAFSLPVHYTILTLLSFVLSGYFTYLLVLQLTRQHLVAFCAGLIFAFCGYRGARFVGHLSLLTTQWMSLALLLAIQAWRRPSWSKGVAAGVGFGLVLLSSPYYLGLFILPVSFAAGLYILIWNRQALQRRGLWQAALAGGLTSLLLCAPFFAQFLSLDSELYEITKKLSLEAERESADLLSWLLPPAFNPIWGRWTAPLYAQFTTQNLVETTLYVGVLTLALAGATLLLRGLPRHTRFWQILAISALLLSLGPSLHFLGKTVFTWMPYRLLLEVPGFYAFRVPSRAGITAALALIVLAAIAFVQVSRKLPPMVRTVALLIGTSLIVANSLFAFPFPSTDVAVPEFYTEIRESAGRNAVLSLPTGEFRLANRNFYELTSLSMYYQTVHQKPLVSGYLARRPERLYIPEQTMPFVRIFFRDGINRRIADLPRMDILPEHQLSTEALYGNELLQRQGIEHVVLNCPARETEECWPATLLLKRALGLPSWSSDGEQVFRTAPVHKRGVPETILNLSPMYDHNVSAPFLNEYGRMREILAPTTITFTAPLPGAWRIQGDLLGAVALSTTLTIDGQPVQPFEIVQPGDPALHSFELLESLAAGQHTLSLCPLSAQLDTKNSGCEQLCLGNLSVSLLSPAEVETEQRLVEFVDETGLHLELHEARLVTVRDDALPNSPTTWLVTAWSTSDRSLRNRLADGTTAAPTLFVHLTNASGAIIGQADHLLAERFLWPDDEAHFYDVVELPTPAQQPDRPIPSEIRLGLWYPESGAYFWSPEEGTLDNGQRIRLPVEVLAQQSITVTDVVRNAAVSASFASADDDRWFEIIDAHVVASDPAQADSPTELVTVWNVENIGHSVETPFAIEAITLYVHFTDREGNILAQADHFLGSNNLSTLLGQRIYDVVAVPPELNDRDDVEVRIGLWIPETSEHIPLQDARLNDGDGRARLGVLADLRRSEK